MSYLGLDIGTTGCKAVVFDERGCELASAYREYAVIIPREGWAELDSSLVCDSCMAVIREAASACPEDPVSAMGISSQGEAYTPVGPDGEMLGNGMVSFDTRAAEISDRWSAEFGREKLYRITGQTAYPMYTVFKLLWLRDNQPEIWARAKAFYCFEDLMHHRLGLEPAISWSLAGRTMMFNVLTHQWDDEILSAVGLDRSKLARPLPSGEIVGTIPKAVSRDLGLSEDTIVVTGGHDQPSGALGAGVAASGVAVYGTGTVECITPAFATPIFSDDLFKNNICTYDFTVRGMYTTVAYNLTGGNILKWFRDEWGQPEVEEAARTGANPYQILLGKIGDKPSSLMVLPYFTPSGTPYFDTTTRGAILGLRLTTKREDVLRALLEGVTFEMRLNLDILDRSGIGINELIAIGGGAKSRAWVQLKADVLNKPIKTVAVTEAGCLGVAMLAMAAHMNIDVTKLVPEWVRITDEVEPNPENASYYDDRFATYLKLYPALRSIS